MRISYSVVFYNTSNSEVRRLYDNITETIPAGYDYDIYLVNNSTENDHLSNCLQEIQRQDEHVKYIPSKNNNGFGAGHNLAIKRLDSDYHFLVNPDISIPNADQIKKMTWFMETHDVAICNPKILNTNGQIQKLVKHTPTILDMGLRFLGDRILSTRQKWFVYDTQYERIHESINLSGSFMVCRSDILKKIGGFDERYFLYMEDADLTRAMAQFGKTMYFPGAYVVHDWQRNNRKEIRGILTMLSSMNKYFSKWGWKFM